ncbi:glutathione S-transferase family protein [Thalassovita mediterranea]|jgi:glutathione S-transferase|uniref:Glutathione S-transferase n=1 Tax=Thalassovita mediterranea TaxID=340021 RepID=A0A0P1GST3_9RHOB|nr:glutathione S-transferase [Thalassovita mediterranea]CUH85634.1 Glutathione S-transferase [Thalassovita mediterranea]SIS30054.1 glutathione S-transferase [Thalassovita mediterranea]
MKITLHHAHEARSMRVLWLLEELGLPYELQVYDFFDKSLRSDSYLALHPAGRVPAVEIDGQVMLESGAIVEYLAERCADMGLGRAPQSDERMAYLDLLHYGETLGQHLANLTQAHIVLYEPWMRSPTQMGLETKRLAKVLGRLEQLLSDGRDYLLASGFSAADVAVGYGIWLAPRFVHLDALPHVAAYRARLITRPAFAKALPPEGARRIYTQAFYEVPNV